MSFRSDDAGLFSQSDPRFCGLTLDEALALPQKQNLDMIASGEALNEVAGLDLAKHAIVDSLFGGLSIEDTSHLLGISPATVKQERATARTWLYQELRT